MVATVPAARNGWRRLLLFRHAKSDWGNANLADIDRPLNGRGRKAAAAMGRFMISAGLTPGLILCSTSVRTRETLAIAFADGSDRARKPIVRFEAELYLASPERIFRFVRETPADVSSLMVIGHNPGMEVLAAALAAPDGSQDYERLEEKFPTAALAVIDVPQWNEVEKAGGKLVAFVTPRRLASDSDRAG